MIKVDGGELLITGAPAIVTNELAYLMKGTLEYLIQNASEIYAYSSIGVARARADKRELSVLKKEAESSKILRNNMK